MIVVVLVVLGAVEALAEAEFGLNLQPEVTGFAPVRFLPIEDQEPTEEHAAEVGEMCNIIRRQTGYRTETGKELQIRQIRLCQGSEFRVLRCARLLLLRLQTARAVWLTRGDPFI